MWRPLDLALPDHASSWEPPATPSPAYLAQLGVQGGAW